jgi:uncharacterized membrane protein YhhN
MKAILKQYGFVVYLVIVVLHLGAILIVNEDLRFITKLLLMPWLAIAVYTGSPSGKDRALILLAILFSFAGDSFLLFDYKNPLYFIFGLVSFLITHILYIIYFIGIKPLRPSILQKHPWIILFITGYGFSLVYFLFPKLGNLKTPVIVYAIIICTMLLCSIHIFKRVNKNAGWLFIGGALLFVISDSLLAVAKFKSPFGYASFLIMLTYCAAQYFIAKGFVQAKTNA